MNKRSSFFLSLFFLLALLPAFGKPLSIIPTSGKEMQGRIQSLHAKVSILNIWATWCIPCKKEFPDFLKLYRNFQEKGVLLFLVSADLENELSQVKKFLQDHGVNFETYIKKQKDLEFINEIDQKWSGLIPTTVMYDHTGKVRYILEGEVTYKQIEDKVLELLKEVSK